MRDGFVQFTRYVQLLATQLRMLLQQESCQLGGQFRPRTGMALSYEKEALLMAPLSC